jgi:fatty-acyl-CoA synthase
LPTDPYPQPVLDLLAGAGDRPVLEHGERRVTGAQLLGLVRRVAAGLRVAGVGPGDGVAAMLGVNPEAFAAIIAAHVVGARVAGVRPGLADEHLRDILGHDIAVVLTDAAAPPAGPRTLTVDGLLSTADDDAALRLSARPDDVARLIYTSGSTGRPKACAQTYAAMSAAWAARPAAWPPIIRELASRLSRHLIFGSLSSQVMMEYGVLALAAGGTMVVADPPALPDALVRHRATSSVITVARLRRLVAEQRRAPVDLSTLRALMVSGSPIDAYALHEARDVLGPVVFNGYGQTETGMISMAGPGDVSGSVGRPPDAVDVDVRGPDGAPVPAGTEGELYVRTPAAAVGYWADPAETAAVFDNGWVRAGAPLPDRPDPRRHHRQREPVLRRPDRARPGHPPGHRRGVRGRRPRRRNGRGGARVRGSGGRPDARPRRAVRPRRGPARPRVRAGEHHGHRRRAPRAERQAGQARPGGHGRRRPPPLPRLTARC